MGQGDPFFPGLFSRLQIAFKHEAHDGVAALAELPEHFTSDEALASMIFVGIVVGAVDHDRSSDAFTRHGCLGLGDMFFAIVRPAASASEDDMTIGVAHGPNNGGLPIGVDPDEMVGRAS